MKNNKVIKNLLVELIIILLFCGVLSLILFFIYRAWRINWDIPYTGFTGDGALTVASVGNFKNGYSFWDLSNFNSHLENATNLIQQEGIVISFILYVLSHIISGIGHVVNGYFYLTYILVGVFAYITFYKVGINRWVAFGGGILYTLMPYHYEKIGYGHISLASYFFVPIICGEIILLMKNDYTQRKREIILVSLVCLMMTGISLYYACFSLVVFAFVFVYLIINDKSKIKYCFLYFFCTILGIVISIAISVNQSGRSLPDTVSTSVRDMGHMLAQSLNIFSLGVPIIDHPVKAIADWGWKIYSENPSTWSVMPLGVLCFGGLLISIGTVLICRDKHDEVLYKCGLVNIYLLIFSAVGGLALLIALLNASIRNFTRMSIFIAYFSVLAICCCFDYIIKRARTKRVTLFIAYMIISVMFLSGIYDISSPSIAKYARYDSTSDSFFVNPYIETEETYLSYQEFFKRVDLKAPKQVLLYPYFELFKYTKYTESGEKIEAFDALTAQLFAPDIEWDNGIYVNSDLGHRWLYMQKNFTVEEYFDFAVSLGNEGIVVDVAVLNTFEGLDKEHILNRLYEIADYTEEDRTGDLVYFDLSSYKERYFKDNYEKVEYNNHAMYESNYDGFEELMEKK